MGLPTGRTDPACDRSEGGERPLTVLLHSGVFSGFGTGKIPCRLAGRLGTVKLGSRRGLFFWMRPAVDPR